jgi:hypothetical protein
MLSVLKSQHRVLINLQVTGTATSTSDQVIVPPPTHGMPSPEVMPSIDDSIGNGSAFRNANRSRTPANSSSLRISFDICDKISTFLPLNSGNHVPRMTGASHPSVDTGIFFEEVRNLNLRTRGYRTSSVGSVHNRGVSTKNIHQRGDDLLPLKVVGGNPNQGLAVHRTHPSASASKMSLVRSNALLILPSGVKSVPANLEIDAWSLG